MKDGSYYEGEFRDGEITGKGYKFNKSRESEYTGEFLEGQYHGKGTLRSKNQTVYQGDFNENMMHGYGELAEFKTNQNYKGLWYYNKRHGQGEQRYSDGSKYVGDWIRDKRQGHGEFTQLDGTFYEGQWRNDLMNGQGYFRHSSDYIYEGLFENGYPIRMATELQILFNEQLKSDLIKINESTQVFKVLIKAINEDSEVFLGKRFVQLDSSIFLCLNLKLFFQRTEGKFNLASESNVISRQQINIQIRQLQNCKQFSNIC